MLPDEDRKVLSDVAAAGGLELSEADWEMLEGRWDQIPGAEGTDLLATRGDMATRLAERRRRWKRIDDRLARGFFQLAAQGYEFVLESPIDERLGQPIEESYPEANETFLRFARTYATLKAWIDARREGDESRTSAGYSVLGGVEAKLAQLFFPTPEMDPVDPDEREKEQRQMLARYETPIDIEDFMKGNAILIRARKGRMAGCLPLFALGLPVVLL